MRLVIDGNNLLMADLPAAVAGIEEAGLCRLLARSPYAADGAGRVVVVLDGGPSPLRVLASPVDAVELRLAGHGREADDAVIALIDACSDPRRLTVVSTDRKVRAAARRRRCRSITSEAFGRELASLVGRLKRGRGASEPERSPAADKPADELSPEDVDRWLDEFGLRE